MFARLLSILRQQTLGALALFVALGGTSYAVATGSIDSREIKNNTVRSKDIRNNDIRSNDVRDRSLVTDDFKQGQLPAGATGAKGDKGDPGPRGPQGVNGATNLVVRTRVLNVAGGAQTTVDCNPGERAVGGGASYSSGGAGGGSKLTQSAPALAGGGGIATNGATPTAWAIGFDGNGVSQPVTFSVVCASP